MLQVLANKWKTPILEALSVLRREQCPGPPGQRGFLKLVFLEAGAAWETFGLRL